MGYSLWGFVELENILRLARQTSWSLETETSVEGSEMTQ